MRRPPPMGLPRQDVPPRSISETPYYIQLKTLEEILERDKRREEDGFPRKIRLGRLIRPGTVGKDKIILVPTTVEEKFYHTEIPTSGQGGDQDGGGDSARGEATGGTGSEKEGDILGEESVHGEGQEGQGAGSGSVEGHDITSNAYDLGKILTEKFKLPNLKDKGKKRSFTRYVYDLTDKNRGFGQFLDKKATLRRIIQTNLALGRIPDVARIDPSKFLVDPRDKVYRILSREKDYESQAMVFFIRDYSASMSGPPTEIVTSQHLMIYSWLAYQYENRVVSRFVLHDDTAREVPDFWSYYNLSIAGGTFIAEAYALVNRIIKTESLAKDYNIYVFHGTDGDDRNNEGEEALEQLDIMLAKVNRLGITLVNSRGGTAMEGYLERSKILATRRKLIRLSVLREDAAETAIIEGIKDMVSEK